MNLNFSLFERDKPIIVGVSGGADSTFLCMTLHNAGYDVIAGFINFKTRPIDNKAEINIIKNFKKCGIKVKTYTVSKKELANKSGSHPD